MMYRISMDVSPSQVSWARITAFVRQLGHDIRNDLNALSLEAALLKELVADPEAVTSATRIQTQLRDIANRLKELSGRFTLPEPRPEPLSLAELAANLQSSSGSEGLQWDVTPSEAQVQTDAVLLVRAFRELTQNAIQHAGLHAKPQARLLPRPEGGALLVLRENGAEEYPWPDTPFQSPKAGHYGIGLPIAAAILRGLGIKVERKRVGEALETELILPAA